MRKPIRHSDTFGSATMIACRTANDCMNWIAVPKGIINALDQDARSTFTTAEARGFFVIRITSALRRQRSITRGKLEGHQATELRVVILPRLFKREPPPWAQGQCCRSYERGVAITVAKG